MKVRITYQEDWYGKEGYLVESKFSEEEEYSTDSFFPLNRREGAKDDEEANFVAFGILNKIATYGSMGFEIRLLDVWLN